MRVGFTMADRYCDIVVWFEYFVVFCDVFTIPQRTHRSQDAHPHPCNKPGFYSHKAGDLVG